MRLRSLRALPGAYGLLLPTLEGPHRGEFGPGLQELYGDNFKKKKDLGLQLGWSFSRVTSPSRWPWHSKAGKRVPLGCGAGLHGCVCWAKGNRAGKGPTIVCCLRREVMSYRNRNLETWRQRVPFLHWEAGDARLGHRPVFWHSWGEGKAWQWSGAKTNKKIKGITYSLLVPTEAGRRRHKQAESHLLTSS